ncbi:hypothetical protein [Burkholderia ubonensis]|uniref:hypothetical protein n=1 Tax=Burkholderia ubonensis TaxID=101571 RepID=UPI0005D9C483|nr:hypothetical protein [Burkholderia ubonensis]AJX17921.1 helix-turn-helix domain protein [Burkholderia ubonensis MSMB22]KWE65318.1 hypothetical protein WL78_23320 [Burkholderia ubonensis]KWI73681.1 hypothetical protein WM07_09250 [Burkholderia ubonensis]KWI93394.1 hypothetical protein WM08_06895 [Burkholderia ubonensis]
MNIKPWSKMPVEWIRDGRLKMFSWPSDGSAGTAALMLYFVICHFIAERGPRVRERSDAAQLVLSTSLASRYDAHLGPAPAIANNGFVEGALAIAGIEALASPPIANEMTAHLTYDDFAAMAGLSRKSISSGLALLEERSMIERPGSARSSDYILVGLADRQWAKLPGQALLSDARTNFKPLTRLNLRSRYELDALKLYFYFASIRSHHEAYSEASYEKIAERTGVSERNIPRANALLVAAEFLARYERGSGQGHGGIRGGSNRYFLEGYKSFMLPARASLEAQTEVPQ